MAPIEADHFLVQLCVPDLDSTMRNLRPFQASLVSHSLSALNKRSPAKGPRETDYQFFLEA